MRAVPWSPDGSDNAFDIQVGMERPAEMVPRPPGEVLMQNKVARTFLRRADFEQWGLSEGCPGRRFLRTGQERQQTHSEACRRRIEALLGGGSRGSARLAAADERINRALADAVERHATKNPGTKGILKRASVVCHRQKKIALDIEQDLPPHTPVSYGGSSGSGARPSDTASNDPNTSTGDVTGEDRTRLEQAARVTLAVVREDSADENRAEHPSSSGSDSRRRITTKREPREVGDEKTSTNEQHVPRKISEKTTVSKR